jgi:hypothetical protein
MKLKVGARDSGFDLIGEYSVTPATVHAVAVQVKHRASFDIATLRSFLGRVERRGNEFDEYILVTSSPLNASVHQVLKSWTTAVSAPRVHLLGQQEVVELLQKNPAIANKYFPAVRRRVTRRRLIGAASGLGAAFSVLALILSLYETLVPKEKSTFQGQIFAVEDSLKGLRALEQSLQGLKRELEQTSEESNRIRREYEEVMKLKVVTAEQLEQIRKAVSSQSAWEVFLNYFFGFLLGVASSALATIIMDRIKKRRALSGAST